MKIVSEVLNNKVFNSVEECMEAEKAYLEEQKVKEAKAKKLAEDRKVRAKEVEDAYKLYKDTLNKFVEDYGSYHFSYSTKGDKAPFSILEDLLDWF